ncbi:hypothetical protein [Acetobacterium malicum]|nr:hypothetical protein [Acetobacterium malicum]
MNQQLKKLRKTDDKLVNQNTETINNSDATGVNSKIPALVIL